MWLSYNTQQEALDASVLAFNFCKVSPAFNQNDVGSPFSAASLWWIELPDTLPLDSFTPISVVYDDPVDLPMIQTEEVLNTIFDNLRDVMQNFMVENTLSGITSADTMAMAIELKDLWYFCQTAPTAALSEVDRLLSLPQANRIPNLVDLNFVSDSRLQQFRDDIEAAIFG